MSTFWTQSVICQMKFYTATFLFKSSLTLPILKAPLGSMYPENLNLPRKIPSADSASVSFSFTSRDVQVQVQIDYLQVSDRYVATELEPFNPNRAGLLDVA